MELLVKFKERCLVAQHDNTRSIVILNAVKNLPYLYLNSQRKMPPIVGMTNSHFFVIVPAAPRGIERSEISDHALVGVITNKKTELNKIALDGIITNKKAIK